ncbi:hypothetical protein CVT25_001241 [Psilocybe cyanescens]|uniref:DUF6699 domain-containing protein n=1 Tax=Psilocybe cyanescens TaxID=93625 RepID=A0A409XAU5_PSICY|nr:hypothetical protein CVT25_001241 [Psilocybe cyanescens]
MSHQAYHRPSYNHHAGFYRTIQPSDDFSKPWENSPISDGADLPPEPLKPVFDVPAIATSPVVGESSASSPLSTATSQTLMSVGKVPAKKKRSLWARIMHFVKFGIFSSDEGVLTPAYVPIAGNPAPAKVELHEWKQYGYWARPILNNVTGINSRKVFAVSSEKSIDTVTLQNIINDMGDESQGRSTPPHKRFIPGVKHRALPPRPTRWKVPVPGQPLPFPWEVQINPLLRHVLWGPSPLTWCLFDDPRMKTVRYGRTPFIVFCGHQDLAQPATWPFLTHMYFNAVAGDTAPMFPWPFCVENLKGITVGDVLEQIYKAFWEPILRDEKESWPMIRQDAAMRALHERCRMCSTPGQPEFEDYMRRCDSLGGVMWFRGIEPTINAGGWMVTFGTH